MNCLELFCGTKSFGKCMDKLGHHVISLDLMKEFEPTHLCDILSFDYKQYPKNHFGIIWASPPCTEYSKLQDCWINRMRKGKLYTMEQRELEMLEADKLVKKSLEIIEYFNPPLWIMENPLGRMKDRNLFTNIDHHLYMVDYCMYSDWGYKKRTCIWTNKEGWNALKCDGKGTCGNMVNRSHYKRLGFGDHDKEDKRLLHKNNLGNTERRRKVKIVSKAYGKGTSQFERYRIPEELIFSLILD